MSVIQNNLLMTPEGYQISRSVRLRSSANGYLNRTAGAPTSNLKYTVSLWMKRGKLGAQQAIIGSYNGVSDYSICYFDANDKLNFIGDSATAGRTFGLTTNAALRDPSAWYHLVFVFDSANATVANRCIMYVNGVAQTVTGTTVPLNAPTYFNTNGIVGYLGQNGISASYNDCYLTEVNFIDGQALGASSFGETDAITGVWKPKKYLGTYGTNGFYLNFSDNSNNTAATIGKDYSGNGNNWTPNNISVTAGVTYDSMIDTPTNYADGGNGRGNYAVVNSLPPSTSGGSWYTQDGNLKLVRNGGGWTTSIATIGVTSGKWYWEVIPQNAGNQFTIGVAKDGYDWTTYLGSNAFGWSYIGGTGDKYTGGVNTAYGATYTTNDVIGVAFDADAGTLTFYKNGTSQGQAYSGLTSGPYYPACGVANLNTAAVFNFGQRPFAYTPPTGFKALNTQNLPDATIKKGSAYFDVSTWTGTGTTNSRTIGFGPDFLWAKIRDSGGGNHQLFDSVRGGIARLVTNTTAAEATTANGFVSLDASGWTMDGSGGGGGDVNTISRNYVGWLWKKGATQGFDIVTGTSTSTTGVTAFNHSLGVTPSMAIVRNRDIVDDWFVWHKGLSAASSGAYYLKLDLTNAVNSGAVWGGSGLGFTSTQFNLNNPSFFTATNQKFVAYLFAEVAGFSRFGSYTGNNSADGVFVYLGFKPRWLLLKDTTNAATNWVLQDTSRFTYNVTTGGLLANTSASEYSTGYDIDILSNGFKIRRSGGDTNQSGATIIYAAFAESPFKNSLAR